MESTFQGFQEDEYFDFDAACGGFAEAEAVPSSNAMQNFEMGGSLWNEILHNGATANNNCLQYGTLADNTFQPSDSFAMDKPSPQPTGNTTVTYNLPDHSWDDDFNLSKNNGLELDDMELTASTGTHNHLDFDPFTQPNLGIEADSAMSTNAHAEPQSTPWWLDDNQQLQGNSLDLVSPPEGRQSGLDYRRQVHITPDLEPDQSAADSSVSAQSRREIRCLWPSCVVDNFESTTHLEAHQITLLGAWSGPIKCGWPKCSSKVIFKHKYLLKAHLANIHVAPLHCTVAGCSYTEPFGKQYDLRRHISTIHGDSQYLCRVESCESNTIGFARKDKLVKHMREKHDNVKCSINHCGSVLLDGEQELHLQTSHGSYECAFGACERGLPSHFSREGLRVHLMSVHNVYRETALQIMWKVDRRVYDTASQKIKGMRRQLAECQGCLGHIPAAN